MLIVYTSAPFKVSGGNNCIRFVSGISLSRLPRRETFTREAMPLPCTYCILQLYSANTAAFLLHDTLYATQQKEKCESIKISTANDV